jgi:hypothetical protein
MPGYSAGDLALAATAICRAVGTFCAAEHLLRDRSRKPDEIGAESRCARLLQTVRVIMDHGHDTPAYGLWSLVLLESAVSILFAFSFFKPRTRRVRHPQYDAFVLAHHRSNRRVRAPGEGRPEHIVAVTRGEDIVGILPVDNVAYVLRLRDQAAAARASGGEQPQ